MSIDIIVGIIAFILFVGFIAYTIYKNKQKDEEYRDSYWISIRNCFCGARDFNHETAFADLVVCRKCGLTYTINCDEPVMERRDL